MPQTRALGPPVMKAVTTECTAVLQKVRGKPAHGTVKLTRAALGQSLASVAAHFQIESVSTALVEHCAWSLEICGTL